MEIFVGGIYEVSEEWHPYDTQLVNHRPVIVIDEKADYVEVLLMGILQKFSNKEKRVMFEVEIKDRKFISVVATDVIHQIPKVYLKSNIGYVKKDVIDVIYEKQGRKNGYEKIEKVKNIDVQEVVVTNEAVFYDSLLKIEENTRVMRDITEKTNSPISIWKERVIGFVFGILSSLVATFFIEVPDWDKIMETVRIFLETIFD